MLTKLLLRSDHASYHAPESSRRLMENAAVPVPWSSVTPWALLIGLNIGPNLAVTGSLAAILWLQVGRAAGARPSARRFTAIGAPWFRSPSSPPTPLFC